MPHLSIKHYPRDFTDEQKARLAEALTAVVTRHFAAPEGAVSIALEPVAERDWPQAVDAPEIKGRPHLLIKTPDYPGHSAT
ncbi:tautomerase family protein [Streptomyces sp. TRM 70351]|uniref:tautomerase family protein n=1 Tax=Streptomyces sp. TRM 70351 TaxID=3116552 RepID=UPI002E7BEDD9|nr:tautomerase family protein [Streptomyces sp. TRM 70351]MEE1931498.1 tautomerase family protein [Streptomyces sp. TRM 70351]